MTLLYSSIVSFIMASHLFFDFLNRRNTNNIISIGLFFTTVVFSVFDSSFYATRIMGVPVGYIPFISIAVLFIGFHRSIVLSSKTTYILFVGVFLISYLFVLSVYKSGGGISDSFPYIIMWIINILVLIAVHEKYKSMPIIFFDQAIYKILCVLSLAIILAFILYILDVRPDANISSLMNRNASATIMVPLLPLPFYLYSKGYIRRNKFFIFIVVLFLGSLFNGSRALLLSQLFVFLYIIYIKFSFLKKLAFFVITIFFSSIFINTLYDDSRLKQSVDTVTYFIELGGDFDVGDAFDYDRGRDMDRLVLQLAALNIINKEPMGTGLGRKNYKDAFERNNNFYRQTKPHNLYLSTLVSFGYIGFSLLTFLLILVSTSLPKSKELGGELKIALYATALFMLFNEYITLTFLWIIFGFFMAMTQSIKKNFHLGNIRSSPGLL